MFPIYELFGSVVPTLFNFLIVLSFCCRFLRAMMSHHKIMGEIEEFNSTVCRARDSVEFIGEQVSKGMDVIKEDVKRELYVTDRLTKLASKMSGLIRQLAVLEERVIELMRMEPNTETVQLETPRDVSEEIRKLVTAAEAEEKEHPDDENNAGIEKEDRKETTEKICRNPISKFSGIPVVKQDRAPVLPEVQLLGGSGEVETRSRIKRREQNRK